MQHRRRHRRKPPFFAAAAVGVEHGDENAVLKDLVEALHGEPERGVERGAEDARQDDERTA